MSLGEPQYPRKPFWWEYPDNYMLLITLITVICILVPVGVLILYLLKYC